MSAFVTTTSPKSAVVCFKQGCLVGDSTSIIYHIWQVKRRSTACMENRSKPMSTHDPTMIMHTWHLNFWPRHKDHDGSIINGCSHARAGLVVSVSNKVHIFLLIALQILPKHPPLQNCSHSAAVCKLMRGPLRDTGDSAWWGHWLNGSAA